MTEYTLKLSGSGIVGYMNPSYSQEALTADLMKVDILPAGDTDEVWLHLFDKSSLMYQFVYLIGEEKDEEHLRCLPLIDINKQITIKPEGIFQKGNRIKPLMKPVGLDKKQNLLHYQGLVRTIEKKLQNSDRGYGDGWKNGESYDVHAVSDIPYYYKGNRLLEDFEGYFTSFDIEVESCCIEFSVVDEDVNLYAVDAIYPSQFAFLVLSSLDRVDLEKTVFINKDGVFQEGKNLSNDIEFSEEEHLAIVQRFKNRLDLARGK